MQREGVGSTREMTSAKFDGDTRRKVLMQALEAPGTNLRARRPEGAFQVNVQGRSLEVKRIPGRSPHAPELVFLHEGLGSVSHWKDFPARVAAATGCAVTVYSRYGNGNSDPLTEPRAVTYMHDEALRALPDLLAQLHVENPILVGHSDGASIALIFAGKPAGKPAGKAAGTPAGAHAGPRGLILLAPHVFVEELSVASIAQAKTSFETTNLPEKLARHHRDPALTFWGWNNIWLHPDFRAWNIEEYLPRIGCPILAIQGIDDEYGTMAQVQTIARQSGGPVEILPLADCRHSPQRDQPEAVLAEIIKFVKQIGGSKSCGNKSDGNKYKHSGV
jgi:pimeloyl-ACP methyl ester carboxylesterase